MEMKACNTCEIEKPDNIDYFYPSTGYKTDGTRKTRSRCKTCQNKIDSEKKKENKINNKIDVVKEVKPKIEIAKKENIIKINKVPALSDEEILGIRKLLNMKFTLNTGIDKSNRIPKSFNIDVDIMEWLKSQAKESNISISDVINQVVRQVMN
jgi:hypothetical protein